MGLRAQRRAAFIKRHATVTLQKMEFSMKRALILLISAAAALMGSVALAQKSTDAALAKQIRSDASLRQVHQMALDLLKTGLNAGAGYKQVWIRDLNTFIEVSLEVNPRGALRDALLTFFKLQGPEGDIPDGYRALNPAQTEKPYRVTPLAPGLTSYKNTVEVDQETSLVQAVYKYVTITGDRTILDEQIDGRTVRDRLGFALAVSAHRAFRRAARLDLERHARRLGRRATRNQSRRAARLPFASRA